MWFLAGVQIYVCGCVCVRFSTFWTPMTHKRLKISIWNLVYQWSNHNPLIVTVFMTIDVGFVILCDFMGRGATAISFKITQGVGYQKSPIMHQFKNLNIVKRTKKWSFQIDGGTRLNILKNTIFWLNFLWINFHEELYYFRDWCLINVLCVC